MAGKRDFYEILGVSKNASAEELKKSYRKKAIECHPDRNPGDKVAEEKFKELSEAYEVLSNPQKRQAYDQFGHAGVSGPGGGPGGFGGFSGENLNDVFGDIFEDFFGGLGGGGRKKRRGQRGGYARQGADLKTAVDITFEDAAKGVEKVITIPKSINCETCSGSGAKAGTQPETCPECQGAGEVTFQQGFFAISRPCGRCQGQGTFIRNPCATCNGRGQVPKNSQIAVKIPAGIDSGQRLKLSGEGEAGERGGPPGDLYVVINVLEHDFFKREDDNIICEVPIRFTQAALGTEIEVPTLQGKVKMKIPAGTQSHAIFRLKGKGMPRLGDYRRGDQMVRVIVETPSKLSAEQKDLLRRLEQSEGDGSHPLTSGFFDKVKNFFE